MKFSLGKNRDIEQSLNITIPTDEIETKVILELNKVQKSSKVKGFRKGKAPLEVVRKMYETEIRLDVINNAMVKKFYDQVEKKGFKPVGKPSLSPESLEKDKDVKFKATFETYPEIRVSNLNKLTYTKIISSISEDDLNKTITNIQRRMCSWEPSEKESLQGDKVKIDFVGSIEGNKFEGGSSQDFMVEIGSRSMIEGFEEGLLGLKKASKKQLALKFPDDYAKTDLASKNVSFQIEVKEVLKPILPDLSEDFFKKTGFEVKTIDEYREQVKSKLDEDLINLIKNKSKKSILNTLREAHSFEVPQAMVESEVSNMRSEAARRMGMDPKKLKDETFPMETFQEEALKRVTVGIILNKIIEEREIKADSEKVRQIIEERASMYKDPKVVVNWFYSNEEQLKNIESVSLEEQVIDILLSEANPVEKELTYEECVSEANLT